MGRLAGISGRKAIEAFCRVGYRIARQRGSHLFPDSIRHYHGGPRQHVLAGIQLAVLIHVIPNES